MVSGIMQSACDILPKNTELEAQKEEEDEEQKAKAVVVVDCNMQHQHLPDDLAFELLTTLPIKKIHQFMCVSKSWCSIVRSPLFFSHAYRRRGHHHPNGGLLVSLLQQDESLHHPPGSLLLPGGARLSFHYSPLKTHHSFDPECEPESFFCRLTVPPPPSSSSTYYCYEGVTQVVDGLVCFYDTANHVYVSNVCSGEIMRLPDSELLIWEDLVQYNYYLGFDKVNKVYKLLKWSLISRGGYVICRQGKPRSTHVKRFKIPDCNSRDYYKECEVLTLGCGCWRKLDVSDATFLPLMFDTQSFCVGGFLYWFSGVPELGTGTGCELIAFDLSKEKFGFIDRSTILPKSRSMYTLRSHRFAQFMGRLAIVSSDGWYVPSIDTFELEDLEDLEALEALEDLEDFETGQYIETGQYKWRRHYINWPVELGRYSSGIVPVGNLPTGEILFADLRRSTKEEGGSFMPIYSFDHQTSKFRKFAVGQFPSSLMLNDKMALAVSVCCLVEKADPLSVLFGEGRK